MSGSEGRREEYQVWRTPQAAVFRHDGRDVALPAGWVFVPSGDPGLTRRLKRSGEFWVLVHRRRNRTEALGLLTDGARVDSVRAGLAAEREDPAYRRRLEAGRLARMRKQDRYAADFRQAVLAYLAFAPRYRLVAECLADAVTDRAVPVGSGTVARTSTLPLETRAEAAVIAWLRHQSTGYDDLAIAHVAGERRRVRRELAQESRRRLEPYRRGAPVDLARCPIARALDVTQADLDRARPEPP